MGLFSGKKDKDGSKGKPGRGFGKGSAAKNPDKYTPRTKAQSDRQDRKLGKWK